MGRPQNSVIKRQREQLKRERKQVKAEKKEKRKTEGGIGMSGDEVENMEVLTGPVDPDELD